MIFSREHTRTPFVKLDTGVCKACWLCIDVCSNQVIGKVDLPWHKHALISRPDACTGCLNCVSICEYNAYSINDKEKHADVKKKNRVFNNFLVNNLLLLFGIIMVYSGLVMQVGFHMGGPHGNENGNHTVQSQTMQYEQIREIDSGKIVSGFNYTSWSAIHKFVIVLFTLLMIYHTSIHWKWYKTVFTKHLTGKNKQVIILSVIFVLVAITGLVPWFIDLYGGAGTLRMLFIEIHDKIALILIVFLILHLIKRAKWYSSAYDKLKS